jgi:hypothetical protein
VGLSTERNRSHDLMIYGALMPAALMIGHHFSISARCNAAKASGLSPRWNLLPQFDEPLADRWMAKGIYCGGVDLGDYRRGRSLRREKSIPAFEIESWQASLINCRNVHRNWQSRFGRNRIRLYGSCTYIFRGISGRCEQHVDLSSDQIQQCRCSTPIGDELESCASGSLK